jgi:phosphoribosyl 1,2-cyclic phosphodiesterase
MNIGITFLGSGSSGNSLVIHSEDAGVMIDAGFSRTMLISRLSKSSICPGIIKALVLSHEHGDHTKGARLFADQFKIPTYSTRVTAQILMRKKMISDNLILFEPGSEFEVTGFKVRSFSVPHDAEETVGFVVSIGSVKIGVATDLGYLSSLCEQRLKGSSILILESNHDVAMQMNSQRHIRLKKRIIGRNGHLSNESAADALGKLITEKTTHIFLSHLSRDCNSHDLVKETALDKLAELNRKDILLEIAAQDDVRTTWIRTS